MPRGFLSPSQIAELQNFPEVLDYTTLVTFFTLTESDFNLIPQRSSRVNRLAFAIQLCALRYIGFFPKNIYQCPSEIIIFFK